jgi:hypothetical protein
LIVAKRAVFRAPEPKSAFNLSEKVNIALRSQMPQIENQVGDGVMFISPATMLKDGKSFGGSGNVSSFVHDLFLILDSMCPSLIFFCERPPMRMRQTV